MARMKNCANPSICGVKKHRAGTTCAAEAASGGAKRLTSDVPSLRPPISRRARPDKAERDKQAQERRRKNAVDSFSSSHSDVSLVSEAYFPGLRQRVTGYRSHPVKLTKDNYPSHISAMERADRMVQEFGLDTDPELGYSPEGRESLRVRVQDMRSNYRDVPTTKQELDVKTFDAQAEFARRKWEAEHNYDDRYQDQLIKASESRPADQVPPQVDLQEDRLDELTDEQLEVLAQRHAKLYADNRSSAKLEFLRGSRSGMMARSDAATNNLEVYNKLNDVYMVRKLRASLPDGPPARPLVIDPEGRKTF